LLIFLADI